MGRWLDSIKAAGRRPLWLDDTQYTSRLLANGAAPWTNVAEWANWRRTALKLLEPDVAVLDVTAAALAWTDARPTVLAGQTEAAGRLRALLCDQGLQAHLRELLQALRALTSKPLALSLISPQRWLTDLDVSGARDHGEDAVEDAAADMSQSLRALSEGGLDAILIREDRIPVSHVLGRLSCYGSLINVARHYRWDVGILLPSGAPASCPGVDFIVAPGDVAGLLLDPSFWRGGPPPENLTQAGFVFAEIPADAEAREVLEQLGKLR
jgi:hypothetical protein